MKGESRKAGTTRSAPQGTGMSDSFFERPILNSPYAYPGRHWELDDDGQPTNRIVELPAPLRAAHPGAEATEASARTEPAGFCV